MVSFALAALLRGRFERRALRGFRGVSKTLVVLLMCRGLFIVNLSLNRRRLFVAVSPAERPRLLQLKFFSKCI